MRCLTIQIPVHCLVNHFSLWAAQDRHRAFNINKAQCDSPRTTIQNDPADSAGVALQPVQQARAGASGVSELLWRWRRQVELGSKTRLGRKYKTKNQTNRRRKKKKNPRRSSCKQRGLLGSNVCSANSLGESGGESWG